MPPLAYRHSDRIVELRFARQSSGAASAGAGRPVAGYGVHASTHRKLPYALVVIVGERDGCSAAVDRHRKYLVHFRPDRRCSIPAETARRNSAVNLARDGADIPGRFGQFADETIRSVSDVQVARGIGCHSIGSAQLSAGRWSSVAAIATAMVSRNRADDAGRQNHFAHNAVRVIPDVQVSRTVDCDASWVIQLSGGSWLPFPEYPHDPAVPATVVIVPELTLRTTQLYWSAMYTFDELSTATA